MTSHGPRTLCNGQETPTQWKSKSMTNWRGYVLEMFTHLKKHGFGKCHSLNVYECRYDASYWKAMHALDIQYIPIWGQFPPHIATTDCCHPIQNVSKSLWVSNTQKISWGTDPTLRKYHEVLIQHSENIMRYYPTLRKYHDVVIQHSENIMMY